MYKITITKIEEKEVSVREYQIIGTTNEKDPHGNPEDEWGYVNIPQIKEISTEIYSQSTDKDINIKKVIDAFNQE
jgi:hypothetical protein